MCHGGLHLRSRIRLGGTRPVQEEKASDILSDSILTRELAIFLFCRVRIQLRVLLPVSVFSCLTGAGVGEILRMGHVLLYLSTDIFVRPWWSHTVRAIGPQDRFQSHLLILGCISIRVVREEGGHDISLDRHADFSSTTLFALYLMSDWASRAPHRTQGELGRLWGDLKWTSLTQCGGEYGHCAAD